MRSYYNLQSDWYDIINENNNENKIWFNYKDINTKSMIYDHITYNSLQLISKSNNFNINFENNSNINKSSKLHISNNDNISSSFIAPINSNILKKNTIINYIDVNPIQFNDRYIHLSPSPDTLSSHNSGIGLSTEGTNIKIWDATTLQTFRILEGHLGDVYCAKFVPNGALILSAGADSIIKLWSVESGTSIVDYYLHTSSVNSLDFMNFGKKIVSAGKDGVLLVTETSTKTCLNKFQSENNCAINDFTISNNMAQSQLYASCENGTILGFDPVSNESICTISTSSVATCLTSSNLNIISGHENGEVNIWDIRHLNKPIKKMSTWLRGDSTIHRLLKDGESIWISNNESNVTDLKTYDELSGSDCLPTKGLISMSLNGNKLIYTGSDDGFIRRYVL